MGKSEVRCGLCGGGEIWGGGIFFFQLEGLGGGGGKERRRRRRRMKEKKISCEGIQFFFFFYLDITGGREKIRFNQFSFLGHSFGVVHYYFINMKPCHRNNGCSLFPSHSHYWRPGSRPNSPLDMSWRLRWS